MHNPPSIDIWSRSHRIARPFHAIWTPVTFPTWVDRASGILKRRSILTPTNTNCVCPQVPRTHYPDPSSLKDHPDLSTNQVHIIPKTPGPAQQAHINIISEFVRSHSKLGCLLRIVQRRLRNCLFRMLQPPRFPFFATV